MKVVYLLNGASLFGGVKVVLQQAEALRALGVAAEVVSPDPAPDWFPGARSFYRQVRELVPEEVGPCDVAVGTIWFTIPAARACSARLVAHLCQCYEALFDGVRERWAEIEAIYRLPTLKLAVSPHLAELIERRTGQPAHWIPQAFDPRAFSPPTAERAPDGMLRVLVAGSWDLPIKGLHWGLPALRPLAAEGWLTLVRLGLEAHPAELALWPEAEWHLAVPPAEVPEIVRGVDAFLGLSDEVEGFGLPALEAMGCARPCLLTDIGASRALDPRQQASLRYPVGDGEAMRAAVQRLRADPGLRAALGRRGRAIAEQFTTERTARALIAAFEAGLAGAATR